MRRLHPFSFNCGSLLEFPQIAKAEKRLNFELYGVHPFLRPPVRLPLLPPEEGE